LTRPALPVPLTRPALSPLLVLVDLLALVAMVASNPARHKWPAQPFRL
jgi:hypothetical protein